MFEEPPEGFSASVDYGDSYKCVGSSSLEAPERWTTLWEAKTSNPSIESYMDGASLYAKTIKAEPDMVLAVLSPDNFVLTDPTGSAINSKRISSPSRAPTSLYGSYTWVSNSEIPGALINQTDVDGNGEIDRLVIIDQLETGSTAYNYYKLVVAPSLGATDDQTYSIGISRPSWE